MIKQICTVLLTVALASSAHAGLRLAGAPIQVPAGTASTTVSLEFVNDTGNTVTLLGGQVFDFSLSVTPYAGSGASFPTLTSSTPDVSTTSFIDVGVTSPSAPEGTLFANNFVGFSVLNGEARALGTFTVDIPTDFIGEFILASTTGDVFASFGPNGDLRNQGDSVSTVIQVGEVAVPEPSSFLFLGLVGTGVLGMRRFRRREEELDEDV